MHDEHLDAGRKHRVRQSVQRLFGVLLVDAETALHGDRHAHGLAHRGDAIADQLRLGHQAGAEAAFLHAIRRAADIEIDFVIAEILADLRRCREIGRIAAAQLQRHRMLGLIEPKQQRPRAMDHRARGEHLGVKARAARQNAMEVPAMPVRPVHHRRNGKAVVDRVQGLQSKRLRMASL